jgi:hypothetical protein
MLLPDRTLFPGVDKREEYVEGSMKILTLANAITAENPELLTRPSEPLVITARFEAGQFWSHLSITPQRGPVISSFVHTIPLEVDFSDIIDTLAVGGHGRPIFCGDSRVADIPIVTRVGAGRFHLQRTSPPRSVQIYTLL